MRRKGERKERNGRERERDYTEWAADEKSEEIWTVGEGKRREWKGERKKREWKGEGKRREWKGEGKKRYGEGG